MENNSQKSWPKSAKAALEVALFENAGEWAAWLEANHAQSSGLWLKLAKKGGPFVSVSGAQALEIALCYGWIDGQGKTCDDDSWLQKFTPRARKSLWSKVNREKATQLIERGQMRPAGLQEIERAQQDGRWDAAYDPASRAQVPQDFQAKLDENPAAQEFFARLNSRNRYAMLFRLQTAKKAETRAKHIEKFLSMLEKGEAIYP